MARQGAVRRMSTVVALLVASLAALPGGELRAAELSIAVSRSSLSLPIFVADTRGYFASEGLAVRLVDCVGGHRCIRTMLDGQASLATSSEMPVMINSLRRSDFAVIATFASSKRDVKIVARRSAGVRSAADLRGKRVATFAGTSAHYFLDLFLLFHGVDPRSVTAAPLEPEQIVTALTERRVDALSTFEPFAHEAVRLMGADAVVLPNARIYTETFNLSALRALVAQREDDLVRLLRALARAQRFIREQPEAAREILRERMKVDRAYVDATWSDFEYRLSLDQPLISTMEGQARWAAREGHIPADLRIPNLLRLVAPGPLRRVDPAAVTLLP